MAQHASVFVYGTLLPELERASVLGASTPRGPALLEADLFDLGPYPGIRPGSGTVVGEVFEVDTQTLRSLDSIEGYREESPDQSLFVRSEAPVRFLADGAESDAWTYFTQEDGGSAVQAGDYRRHLLEVKRESQWVLSYGSNISTQRLEERIGPVSEMERGEIPGFELVFNKKASRNRSAYANIRFADTDMSCPAVAFRLSPPQINKLDLCEGVIGRHYIRMGVVFRSGIDGNQRIVQAYLAHPDKLVFGEQVDPRYLEHIVNGYREHGIDEDRLTVP